MHFLERNSDMKPLFDERHMRSLKRDRRVPQATPFIQARVFRGGFPALISLLLWLAAQPVQTNAASAVFGGGPFYSGGASVMNSLRGSGFTTVILWCIHVDSSTGNLIYNDQLIVANGVYVGNSAWPSQLATLKTAPTSVNRIEVSVGSWGVDDFGAIRTLMNTYGTNTTSLLYRNFLALKNATGAAAVDFDDEVLYDATSAVAFGRMLSYMGYKVTLCPYTGASFWQRVYSQLGTGIVDRVYLQCYAGGANNSPSTWNSYFAGTKVMPGMWCRHGTACAEGNTPAEVGAQMAAWRASADSSGGFMWLFDDMQTCSSQGTAADYADAINQAVDPMAVSSGSGFYGAAAYSSRCLPAATAFVLTNRGATALSWSAVNTSPWLTVTPGSGSLAAGGTATVTTALNPQGATNLAQGQYSAAVSFSDQSTGTTWKRYFSLNTAVANWPLSLTGYNAALLASNNATSGSPGATAFDTANNFCFCQVGLGGSAWGLPLTGGFASLCDTTTAFQLGAYGASDCLLLGASYPKSATLTLNPAQALSSIAVLASSANGGGQGTFVLNFTNGTKSPAFAFNAQDWFNVTTNVAIQGFGRLSLPPSFGLQNNGASNPNLYQTTLNLAALGLTQAISSITFSNPATAGASQNTAIFAVSGLAAALPVAVPTGLLAVPGTNKTARLAWSNSTGVAYFNIKRSTASGGPYAVVGTSADPAFTDTGLVNGVGYYYVVSAVGASGESANSAEAGARPDSYLAWTLTFNPAGYWPLSETNGTVARDYIAGNNGAYSSTVLLGQPGNPLVDGHKAPRFGYLAASGSCVLASNLDFATPSNATFSVEAWVNGGDQTTDAGLVSKGNSGGGEQFDLDFAGSPRAFRFFIRDSSGGVHAAASSVVPNSRWHHLVGVCDEVNSNVTLYVDGSKAAQGSVSPTAGLLSSSLPLSIGSRPSGSSGVYDNQFAGYLEEVAVYRYALSAAQVQARFQTASNRAPAFLSNPISLASVQAGRAYAQSVATNATDPNGDTLTFSKISGPAWLSVSGSGSVSGTPLSANAGSNSFVLRVADSSGLSATSRMSVMVLAAPALVANVAGQGANVVLSWSGGIAPYQIQVTTNLSNPDWQTLGAGISGTNFVLKPTNGQAFYRLLGN
jgi:hypothetical protein